MARCLAGTPGAHRRHFQPAPAEFGRADGAAQNLKRDLAKINEVYNEAWQKNWGFVPMTDAEISYMAEQLKPILMECLVWIAEKPERTGPASS